MKRGVILLLLIFFSTSVYADEKIKIAYIVTRGREDMFYGLVTKFADEAAVQLGIELDIYAIADNHLRLKRVVEDIVKKDYNAFMFVNLKKIGIEILEIAEEYKMPVLVENSGIINPKAGKPRGKYKYWIGELLPNDMQAGYLLAKELFKNAEELNFKEFVAIEGLLATGASIERVKGLKKALKENQNMVLKQKVPAFWERGRAKDIFLNLNIRYENLDFVWSASDGMALGVVDACKEIKLIPGKDILTGGIDWSEEGIEAVRNGEIVASAGGHFMEGAWGLILIHDYLKGIDFANEDTEIRSAMSLITSKNLWKYEEVLDEQNWSQIDFRYFSKYYNKGLKKYIFSPEEVLNQLKNKE